MSPDVAAMRLVLAEDSVLLREGLSRILAEAGFDVVAVAGDGDGALQLVDKHRPDVAVLDIRMPPTHTVAGLLILGRRAWPGILVGGFLGSPSEGVTGWAIVGVHVGQTLAPLAAVTLLRAFRFDDGMNRVRDVLQLVFVGGGASVINASVGSTVLVATDVVPSREWVEFGLTWWVADAMGVILVAPLLLTWRAGWRSGISPHGSRLAELSVLLLTAAIVTPLLFRSNLPLIFLTFPLVLWPALRIGPMGVSAVNVVVAGSAVWATFRGHGPFSHLSYLRSLIVLEAFNGTIATTSLLLGAAVTTTKGLSDANEGLHAEIRRQLEDVRASRARIVQAAEGERRRIERNLHDGATMPCSR